MGLANTPEGISDVILGQGIILDACEQVERHREAQQQAPAAPHRPPPDRTVSERPLASENADHSQENQGGYEVHLITASIEAKEAKEQCADHAEEGHRRYKPTEN